MKNDELKRLTDEVIVHFREEASDFEALVAEGKSSCSDVALGLAAQRRAWAEAIAQRDAPTLAASRAVLMIPEGYVLVPIECTPEMIRAGYENREGPTPYAVYRPSAVGAIYADMIAAAPTTVQTKLSVQEPADLRDFTTHRGNWRDCIVSALNAASGRDSVTQEDQKSYWQHELNAYDNAMRNFDAYFSPPSAPAAASSDAREGGRHE